MDAQEAARVNRWGVPYWRPDTSCGQVGAVMTQEELEALTRQYRALMHGGFGWTISGLVTISLACGVRRRGRYGFAP